MALERYFQSARPDGGGTRGTLVLLPYHCPPGKQALYTRTTRGVCTTRHCNYPVYLAAEVQSRAGTSKKGKACHSRKPALAGAIEAPISGCLNVKMRGARHPRILVDSPLCIISSDYSCPPDEPNLSIFITHPASARAYLTFPRPFAFGCEARSPPDGRKM